MFSKLSPSKTFTIFFFLTLISALPIQNTLESTPIGAGAIYTEVNTEPNLPRDENTSRPYFRSKLGQPILPREHNSDNVHVAETGIRTAEEASRLPRTLDHNGKAEVWVEAKFDPRAEVANGRGATQGKWRSAANQFLPS